MMAVASSGKCSRALLMELLKRFGMAGLEELAKDQRPYQDNFVSREAARSLTKEQLQALPVEGERLLGERCILLPHFNKDNCCWLPVVWIHLHDGEDVSIQLVIAGVNRRFGFRWEAPESGSSGASAHGFWHAQPMTSARRPNGTSWSLELQHEHISDHFPTFPIDALNAVQLLDAMMVSLYGSAYSAKMVVDASVRAELDACRDGRQWASGRSRESAGGAKSAAAKRNRR